MSKQETWGNVRLRNSQLEKIDKIIEESKEYDSRSDFVSQKLSVALERYEK